MKYLNSSSLITLLFMTISLLVKSQDQSICFTYDASGNRITRTICLEEKAQEITEYTDSSYVIGQKEPDGKVIGQSFNIGEMQVRIYPNPNGGTFNIELEGKYPETIIDLTMHTISGSVIVEKNHIKTLTHIDISNQPKGTYILTLIMDGQKETWKVVKK